MESMKNTEKAMLGFVSPYKECRDYLNSLCKNVKWIYLTYNNNRGREKFHLPDFEVPLEEGILKLNTSRSSLLECKNKIIDYITTIL